MNDPSVLTIHAPGVDTEALVRDIQDTVARKQQQGVYADARIARAERSNLVNLRDDESFTGFYLTALREASAIDINDFEIRERRARFAPLLVKLKKSIWNLLKFYTYRLWSQQNLVNGLFVTGMESINEQLTSRIKTLEARVAELEKKLDGR
ncbi:MAG TPA: hypothetical protein PKC67_14750 [Kiritimatiellia bacterium]|nr:hypothetical protein [Kiritimatiellia bacterium]HMP35593.1 hypothetical protein [Kiritimatiellia bacterium]